MSAQDFIEEYESLCRRHGMMVGGCGCCNSPFIDDIEDSTRTDGSVYRTAEQNLQDNLTSIRNSVAEEE